MSALLLGRYSTDKPHNMIFSLSGIDTRMVTGIAYVYNQTCTALCDTACLCGVVYLILGVLYYRRNLEHRGYLTLLSAGFTILTSLLIKHSPHTGFHMIYDINCLTGLLLTVGGAALTTISYKFDEDDPEEFQKFGCCACAVSSYAKAVVYLSEYLIS